MRRDWWPPWMPTDLLFLVNPLPPSIQYIKLWQICIQVSVWITFTILFPAQGLKDLLEDNGLNQLPRSRPNMWVTYFVVLPKHIRPVGWVHFKFGYFRGKARGIKAHYEEVKEIQEEIDALAIGGPEMDHELSMVRTWECQHQSITSLCSDSNIFFQMSLSQGSQSPETDM